MVKHRSLNLTRFVNSISWEHFDRYFSRLSFDRRPEGWALLNADAMYEFLEDPASAEASAIVQEEFRRINDLCSATANLVVQAYQKYRIPLPDAPLEELAIRLFLDHEAAFRFAWTLHLLRASTAKLSYHALPCPPISVEESYVAEFRTEISSWFASLAKGGECYVDQYEVDGDLVFHVTRGAYIKTYSFWHGNRVEFTSFRPAHEDLIVYYARNSMLSIRAGTVKDREHYLHTFASCIARNESLLEEARSAQVFSLVPFQDGTFDFAGDDVITGIMLTRIKLRLYDSESTVIDLRSKDARESLRKHFKDLSLASGELLAVRLRIELRPVGESSVVVNFEIEPPCRTDLVQKKYVDVIERYLKS